MSNLSSTKKSVRLSAESVAVIKEISQNEINYNGAINNIIERYKLVVAKSLPPLSEHERLAIAQAYNGHWVMLEAIEREVDTLPWQIDQAVQYDGNVRDLLEQGGVSVEEFLTRVRAWSFAEKLAVLHSAVAFWDHGDIPEFADDGSLVEPRLTLGSMLQAEYLDEMNISVEGLSQGSGISTNDLKAVLAGERDIDKEEADKLGGFFGTSGQFWLNLQTNLNSPKKDIPVSNRGRK